MPRQNPTRTVGREEVLAGRIAELRVSAQPPMSYDALAKRMAFVGCPIQPSAIQRIEKGNPRRKVTVDELVAFAQVFDVTVDDLIALPEGPAEQAQAQLDAYQRALLDWRTARERLAASAVEEEMSYKILITQRKNLTGWQQRLAKAAQATSPDEATPETGDMRALAAFLREVKSLQAVKNDIDHELSESTLPVIIVPAWRERVGW